MAENCEFSTEFLTVAIAEAGIDVGSEILHDKEGFFGDEQAWCWGAACSRGEGGVINVTRGKFKI